MTRPNTTTAVSNSTTPQTGSYALSNHINNAILSETTQNLNGLSALWNITTLDRGMHNTVNVLIEHATFDSDTYVSVSYSQPDECYKTRYYTAHSSGLVTYTPNLTLALRAAVQKANDLRPDGLLATISAFIDLAQNK